MVDSVLAPKAPAASDVGKSERAKARALDASARTKFGAGQRAFGTGLSGSAVTVQPASNDQLLTIDQSPVGQGLLSTGVQILLAETRSQESSALFVPSGQIDSAINSYTETQGHVRETIRANTGRIVPNSTLGGAAKPLETAPTTAESASGSVTTTPGQSGAGATLRASTPIEA